MALKRETSTVSFVFYLEILGVNRDSSQSDIKKAYYKLAQTHHPDVNQQPDAKDKFSEINGYVFYYKELMKFYPMKRKEKCMT